MLRNCIVIDTVNNRVRVKTSEGEKLFPITTIDEIIKSPFEPSQPTYVVETDGSERPFKRVDQRPESEIRSTTKSTNGSEKVYAYPNSILLPVSAIALGLAWDYFGQASDIQSSIDSNNKLAEQIKYPIDNSKLESQKTRKTILAITFLAAGIANTVLAFKRVELTGTSNSITLSYKF
jgi:hypothetical protein